MKQRERLFPWLASKFTYVTHFTGGITIHSSK
jgi:hypothetical protein